MKSLQLFWMRQWKGLCCPGNFRIIAFDSAALAGQPVGLQRNLIRRAIEHVHPDRVDINYATLERATHFISDPDASHHIRVDLTGGIHLLREGPLIYIAARNVTLPVERWPPNAGRKQCHFIEHPWYDQIIWWLEAKL